MNQTPTTIGTMRSSGLTEADIARLIWLRHQVRTGTRTEIPMEHKRFLFARYLYEQGSLHD